MYSASFPHIEVQGDAVGVNPPDLAPAGDHAPVVAFRNLPPTPAAIYTQRRENTYFSFRKNLVAKRVSGSERGCAKHPATRIEYVKPWEPRGWLGAFCVESRNPPVFSGWVVHHLAGAYASLAGGVTVASLGDRRVGSRFHLQGSGIMVCLNPYIFPCYSFRRRS